MQFSGFPPNVNAIAVPEPVLGELLEQIQDLAELIVTLRFFWLVKGRRGILPAVPQDEFLNDKVLVQTLSRLDGTPKENIQRGLDLAVNRQTILAFHPDRARPGQVCYAINMASNRRALTRQFGVVFGAAPPPLEQPAYEPAEEKPNIFALYENNIGTIGPLMSERLRDAENEYPRAWINDAFQIAVTQNKRSWAYISAILKRWEEEGKDDGKSGGHSAQDNRGEYIEEFRLRRGEIPGEYQSG